MKVFGQMYRVEGVWLEIFMHVRVYTPAYKNTRIKNIRVKIKLHFIRTHST